MNSAKKQYKEFYGANCDPQDPPISSISGKDINALLQSCPPLIEHTIGGFSVGLCDFSGVGMNNITYDGVLKKTGIKGFKHSLFEFFSPYVRLAIRPLYLGESIGGFKHLRGCDIVGVGFQVISKSSSSLKDHFVHNAQPNRPSKRMPEQTKQSGQGQIDKGFCPMFRFTGKDNLAGKNLEKPRDDTYTECNQEFINREQSLMLKSVHIVISVHL